VAEIFRQGNLKLNSGRPPWSPSGHQPDSNENRPLTSVRTKETEVVSIGGLVGRKKIEGTVVKKHREKTLTLWNVKKHTVKGRTRKGKKGIRLNPKKKTRNTRPMNTHGKECLGRRSMS